MPLLLLTIVLSAVLMTLSPPGGYLVFEFPALYPGPAFDPTFRIERGSRLRGASSAVRRFST